MRLIRRQPIFAATAILSLALGLGLTAIGLAVLEGTTFATLPFENGDRYVRIAAQTEPEGRPVAIDEAAFHRLSQAASLDHVGALGALPVTLELTYDDSSSEDHLASVRANLVTPFSLEQTGARLISGRSFDATDRTPRGEPTVLISERLWRSSRLGSAMTVGGIAKINGIDHTILGILPESIEFPAGGELWLPIRDDLSTSIGTSADQVNLFGILASDRNLTQTKMELDQLLASTLRTDSLSTVRAQVGSYTDTPEGWTLGMGVLIVVLTSILLVSSERATVSRPGSRTRGAEGRRGQRPIRRTLSWRLHSSGTTAGSAE